MTTTAIVNKVSYLCRTAPSPQCHDAAATCAMTG